MKKIIAILLALVAFSFAGVDLTLDAGVGIGSSALEDNNLCSLMQKEYNSSCSSIMQTSRIAIGGTIGDFAIGGNVSYQAHYVSAGKGSVDHFAYLIGPYLSLVKDGFIGTASLGYGILYFHEDGYDAFAGNAFAFELSGAFRIFNDSHHSPIVGLKVFGAVGSLSVDGYDIDDSQFGVSVFIGYSHR